MAAAAAAGLPLAASPIRGSAAGHDARLTARFELRLADDRDDAEIQRLLAQTAFPGDVRLSLERAPSPTRAGVIEGDVHQLIAARDRATGALAGIASRSAFDAYVNGRAARLGYLGQLRLARNGSHLRSLMAAGFSFCRELHQAGDAPFYLMSIVSANLAAERLLTDLRPPSAPRLFPMGRLRTFVLPAGGRVRRPPAGVRLETGSRAAIDDIAACLDRNLRRYQCAPRWTSTDLLSERTRGLEPRHFVVARDSDNRAIGCLAGWNQGAFKQAVVRGYSPRLARWRPLVTACGRVIGVAPLPPVGRTLPLLYLSHAAVDDDRPDVLAALVSAQRRLARARKLDHVVTAFVPEHPFHDVIARRFRHRAYDTRLFAAAWPDGEAYVQALDRRVLQPEVALL